MKFFPVTETTILKQFGGGKQKEDIHNSRGTSVFSLKNFSILAANETSEKKQSRDAQTRDISKQHHL